MRLIKTILLLLSVCLPVFVRADITTIKFAFIGNARHDAYLGARQGLEEANLQGRFLGLSYSMDAFSPVALSAEKLEPYTALLVSLDKQDLLRVMSVAGDHPVFNLVSEINAFRCACRPHVLHIIPSKKMKQAAVALGQEKYQKELQATAWHHDFVKYAARDLNKRFTKEFNKDMTEYAWAGWAAVKMTSDAIARGAGTEPEALLAYLRNKLSFDGQKGTDMNFDSTGQLRQLLLLTDGDELVGEVFVEHSKPLAE